MANRGPWRGPPAWYMREPVSGTMPRTSMKANPRGVEIFSIGQSRLQSRPRGGPNNSDWKYDPTIKRAPRRQADLQPARNTKTNRLHKWLLRIPHAGAWISGIITFVLALTICVAFIGTKPSSFFIADSPSELASEICNLPLVRTLPPCPSSAVARETLLKHIRNETCRWPLIRWTCTSDSLSGYSSTKLYQEISSTQALIKEKLMGDLNYDFMAIKLQLGLDLVRQSKPHVSFSDVPFKYGISEAYTGLIADLDRSLICLLKFSVELDIAFNSLSTGLPYLSRELAQLESHSHQRFFLTRPLFRSSDEASMLGLYLSHMKTFDNETTELLLKGHACFMQLPSLEADWHLVSNLTANSSRSLRHDLNSERGPSSAFLPAWMTPQAHSLRIREISAQLELVNTLHLLHVEMWPEIASVAHNLEEVEMAIVKLQQRFSFETAGLDAGFPRAHLYLALVDARNAEREMVDRRLRKWVLLDRLWEKGTGERVLMDPLWLGGKGAEILEGQEGQAKR